jgi:pimeloyl-ACP methyl ester carboxylesterase
MKYFFATVMLSLSLILPANADTIQITHQGIALNGVLTLAEEKNLSTDGIVMMVHGTLGHAKMDTLTTLQAVLNEYGYNVLSINLSLGVTDRPLQMYTCDQPQNHQHTDALGEIGAWLQWLATEKAVTKVTLLGHSRGGNQVAWFMTTNDTPLVNAVVLLAPMTHQVGTQLTEKQQEVLAAAQQHIALEQPDALLEEVPFLYCPAATASATAIVSYVSPEPKMHTPNLLTEIAQPTLVIAGSEDDVVMNLAEQVTPLIEQHERLKYHEVMGAGHFFRDLYAYDVADAINDFLGR